MPGPALVRRKGPERTDQRSTPELLLEQESRRQRAVTWELAKGENAGGEPVGAPEAAGVTHPDSPGQELQIQTTGPPGILTQTLTDWTWEICSVVLFETFVPGQSEAGVPEPHRVMRKGETW